MAVDLGLALFDYDDPNLAHLCHRIDLSVFEIAEQAKLEGLIFTFADGGSRSDPFIADVIRRYQNDIYFIHLFCDVAELKRRVGSKDRQEYKKVTDVSILMDALERINYAKDIAHPNHLTIDTTGLSPIDAARRIVEYFRL